MVGTIKRWLGIDVLERENLTMARALNTFQIDAKKTHDIALDCEAVYKDHETRLRSIESEPKAEPKPRARTVPFRQFKSVAESLPEED